MYKVVAADNAGSFYPIAFFKNLEDAQSFTQSQKPKWRFVYFSPCEAAILKQTLIKDSKWELR